jgi:putative transposase
VFFYADEFNVSWQPTLRSMWSPVNQQVMIPTPGKPNKHYGIGAVNYHTGETFVIFRKRKKREQIAELVSLLLKRHPDKMIFIAWDNVHTHKYGIIQKMASQYAERLKLLYLPTYSPWLNPIEMLWRHYRREVTHCELFESVEKLIGASIQFFKKYNQTPNKTLSIIGNHAA